MADYYRSKFFSSSNDTTGNALKKDTLLTREQQLKEEIAKLRKEKEELEEKDYLVKRNIEAVREKMATEKRY
ncbi:hypothetical protein G6F37_006796 [Rhizopus arrhizus]|nr:hypothetical protein G6F38_008260 [Rhizopus arrhizus]KAG1157335.1 hypothetical protein G6F37_006796 [Rhizopus arrhizus]